MSDKIIWVANKNGTGWSSSRTRDLVDLAFSLGKEYGTTSNMLTVRACWATDDPKARAVRVIGRMYFEDSKATKELVEKLLSEANATYTDLQAGRTWMLTELLRLSMPDRNDPATAAYDYPYINANGRYIKQSDLVPVSAAAPAFDATAMVEKIKEAEEVVAAVLDLSKYKPGDVPPNGYIWMGKELVKIGWPS